MIADGQKHFVTITSEVEVDFCLAINTSDDDPGTTAGSSQ